MLSFPYVPQSENNWCWAACAEMLLRNSQSQCSVASSQFQLTCCPSPRAPASCDRGAWPHLAYPPLGLPTQMVTGQLSLRRVQTELASGKAVQVCYQWTGGNQTHVALIVGEHANGDFEVLDPSSAYGRGARTFGQIQTAYGLGAWVRSFTF